MWMLCKYHATLVSFIMGIDSINWRNSSVRVRCSSKKEVTGVNCVSLLENDCSGAFSEWAEGDEAKGMSRYVF